MSDMFNPNAWSEEAIRYYQNRRWHEAHKVCLALFLSLLSVFSSDALWGDIVKRESFSLELPSGWKMAELGNKDTVSFLSPSSGGYHAVLAIFTQQGTDSSADISVKGVIDGLSMGSSMLKTGEPVLIENDYYMIPVTSRPGGFFLTGVRGSLADHVAVIGYHPELPSLLRSLKASPERPYLQKLSGAALRQLTATSADGIGGKTVKRELFSVKLPNGWSIKSADGESANSKMAAFISPPFDGYLSGLLVYTFKSNDNRAVNIQEFMKHIVVKDIINMSGKPILTEAGYYMFQITGKEGGFCLVGTKGSLAGAFVVMGYHPDLPNLLRSFIVSDDLSLLKNMSQYAVRCLTGEQPNVGGIK